MLFSKFHVVVFRDSRGGGRTFCLRGYTILLLIVSVVALAAGNALLWTRAGRTVGLEAGLRQAEKTVQEQKIQLISFSSKLKSLEEDLSRVRDFDTKIRVMLALDQAPSDTAAQGGVEETGFSEGYLAAHRQELLARKMHTFLDELREDSRLEEVRQHEMMAALTEKQNILSSTPSIWPAVGWVSSTFGYRTSPFTGRREMHKGIDISGPTGTPIYAPASGKVTSAGRSGGYGLALLLSHGNGITTRYAHMDRFTVKAGEVVRRGDLLGYMGNTGRSTGPHLHYEVKVNGVFVNPNRYILN